MIEHAPSHTNKIHSGEIRAVDDKVRIEEPKLSSVVTDHSKNFTVTEGLNVHIVAANFSHVPLIWNDRRISVQRVVDIELARFKQAVDDRVCEKDTSPVPVRVLP